MVVRNDIGQAGFAAPCVADDHDPVHSAPLQIAVALT
jgi:hypothetical protein